jgi:hypothetical protein
MSVRSANKILFAIGLLIPSLLLAAKLPLPSKKLKGAVVKDLPAPYNLQAVTGEKSVALNWSWDMPNPGPAFRTFGFDVLRDNQIIATVDKTAFTDVNAPIRTNVYQVVAKGETKEFGKNVVHLSGLSEPVEAVLQQRCSGPPAIKLRVEPTKKIYGSIPSLRLHFTGDVRAPSGCEISKVMYHIDSGMANERSGPLSLDPNGRFDEFIDAMGPEDEYISGNAVFSISVTARTEVGDASSDVYKIDLERENPFAPKQR